MTTAPLKTIAAFFLPLLLLSTAGAAPAKADDNAAPRVAAEPDEAPSDHPNWALQVTPYLWAAGIEGDISPFRPGPTIGIDKSFSDVLENLNLGGFVNIWARYDRFVFSGDVMYVDTTDSKTSGPLPIVGAISGSVDTIEFNSTLQAGYRVLSTPTFTLDALGGVRIWHISNDVTVNAGPLTRSYGEDFGWVDPVIGLRAFWKLTDRVSLQAQVDGGGFGVGSESTVQALGTVNFVVNDKLSVSAGYKVLDVDYRDDGHVFDTTLQGPVLGMTYRF